MSIQVHHKVISTAPQKRDVETGHLYIRNIRQKGIVAIDTEGNKYRIVAQNETDDVWYNGRFLGTNYAVFKGWQQVSPWYKRQGWAVRVMKERAFKENITITYISDIERTSHRQPDAQGNLIGS